MGRTDAVVAAKTEKSDVRNEPLVSEIKGHAMYLCGSTEDSPVQNIDLHGVGFPRFRTTPEDDGTGKLIQGGKQPGALVPLSEEDIKRVHAACKQQFVRWHRNEKGEKTTGQILSRIAPKGHVPPREMVGDEPVSKYVYMVDAENMSAVDFISGKKFPTLFDVLGY